MGEERGLREAWLQAGGGTAEFDQQRYRDLLTEWGLLIPREPGDHSPLLPCGWPPHASEEPTDD